MKKTLLSLSFAAIFGSVYGQSVFINEIHYDNPGTDANEGVEIAGPAGTDLSTYSLVFYNGTGGADYATLPLTGTLANQSGCGYGVAWFLQVGVQNGAPDAIALVNGGTNVIQFLSYEGVLTATSGPAIGLTSTDIGVSQTGAGTAGNTLQLTGSGTVYTDFTWAPDAAQTIGQINNAQDFCTAPSPTIAFSVSTQSASENAGTATVTLTLNVASASNETVEITITDNSAVYGSDYSTTPAGAAPFNVNIPAGNTSATIDINIINDANLEGNEDFNLQITSTSTGIQVGGISTLTFTIVDNDLPTTPISTVQATTSGDQSDMLGQVVTVGGRVTAVKTGSGFWIQDKVAAWSGIYVFNSTNTVAIGDSVILTGTVAEFAPGASVEKATQIASLTAFSNEGPYAPYGPMTLSTVNVNAEMYEGVLVKVSNASTTAAPDTFNEWDVNDGTGAVKVDDFLYLTTPAPVLGNVYNVTGVVSHSFGFYKILPRDVNDVELVSGASVTELNEETVSVYPNPSNGVININNVNNETIEVYNTLGSKVMTTKQTQFNLKDGLYLIKVGNKTFRVLVK